MIGLEQRNGGLFCDILCKVLKREEEEILRIGTDKGRPEHFLLSVAFAPELAIGYLIRKEALRRGIPIESEHRCEDRNVVDICFVKDNGYKASLEIKGPWGIWGPAKDLRKDVQKVLRQAVSGIPLLEKYNAWILVLEDATTVEALEEFVKKTISGVAEVVECVVSPPIPINRTANAVSAWNGHKYESLRVVVFSARGIEINQL